MSSSSAAVPPQPVHFDGHALIIGLLDVFDGPLEIEAKARKALLELTDYSITTPSMPLPHSVLQEFAEPNAHPLCALIADLPLPWCPPQTSPDPAYVAHSHGKLHVELLGPSGLIRSDSVRLGLYGYAPNVAYGHRTHPAEEVFIMMAGRADWARGDGGYQELGPGARSHHATMMPHATRSRDRGFMSAYTWVGDLSTDHYAYSGRKDIAGQA